MKQHLVGEVGLVYKTDTSVADLPQITAPEQAYRYLLSIWDTNSLQLHEHVVLVMLNNDKKVLGWSRISTGSSRASVVDPKHVFQLALLGNCESFIMAHNHPSGTLRASAADIQLTKRLHEVGELLSIPLVDHIILTSEGYLSMKTRGLF
jgi:DNA repair protein RadC